jgi:ABC-type dipeptide/oligopeptide/nickel transport system permease component
MVRRQQGLTLMSFVMVLVIVGFFAVVAMKLFPMYSEFNSLKSIMDAFAQAPGAANMTPAQVYADLERRFDIGYVDSIRKEHIKINRAAGVTTLQIAYEVRKPLFANLDVVGKFDNSVRLGGPPQAASE